MAWDYPLKRELTAADWIAIIVMMTAIYVANHGWPA
jgi:hypothetical protein